MIKNALTNKVAEEDEIVERIYAAVMDQRLAAGTKLSEISLCQIFNVGRMRIRRSLLLLANRQIVELQTNRGAFVAKPSAQQAQEVFEARLALEPLLAEIAANKVTPSQIKGLERHLRKESAAHASGDRKEAIRLSGQFHTDLALLTQNEILAQVVKDLITRSSLIIGMFGETGVINCRDEEHAGITQALRSGDASLAKVLMTKHICHIQEHIDLTKTTSASADLQAIFGLN